MARTRGIWRAALAFAWCRSAAEVAAESRSCPRPSKAVSSTASPDKVKVVFSSDVDATFDVFWVGWNGQEQLQEPLYQKTSIDTYEGHVFRVVANSKLNSDSGRILLLEYKATAQTLQEVTVETCREFETAWEAESREGTLARSDEFEALVHERVTGDDFVPCRPEGKSHEWSCIRRIPRDVCEDRHRNVASVTEGREFGFKKPRGEWKVGSFEDRKYDWQQTRIPQLSDGHGFLKMNMTRWLKENLLPWYKQRHEKGLVEVERAVEGGYMNDNEVPNGLASLDTDVPTRTAVVKEVGQVLEWWTKGSKLKHHSTFGVRVYHRNATLLNHVDRKDTHLASVVLQVDQQVDEDGGWPIEVLSLDRDCYEIYLQPGEMLLYEGARYAHGRPMRFRGEFFANAFSHFSPKSWTGPGTTTYGKKKPEL